VAAPSYPGVVDARDHAAFYLNLSRTGGAVVPYRTGGRPAFLVNRPDLASRVLADPEGAFRNPYHPYAELAGQYAPAGSLLLRLARGPDGRAAAGDTAREMEDAARAFAGDLPDGEPVAVEAALKERTFRSTARLLFGVDPGELAAGFVAAIAYIEECWGNGMFRDGAAGPPVLAQAYVRANADQDAAADWIIRRAGLSDGGTDPGGLRTTVLRTLLNGYNATGTTLAWTLHLLASHPDQQARLRHELRAAGDDGRAARLPQLRRVVSEVLRLYPPAWMLGRTAERPVRLGDAEIPGGAIVSVSPYAMQRHPALWDRPSEFRPERFAPEEAAGRPRGSVLPFGAGARRCPAAAMVPGHLHAFLAVLLRTHAVERADDTPVRPRGLVALRADPPLRLRFVPNAD
jgi:cytochrome P450